MVDLIEHVLRSGAVLEVLGTVVLVVPVEVPDFEPLRARSVEGEGDQGVNRVSLRFAALRPIERNTGVGVVYIRVRLQELPSDVGPDFAVVRCPVSSNEAGDLLECVPCIHEMNTTTPYGSL